MAISIRANGSWLISFYAGTSRVRKSLPAIMSRSDVVEVERRLLAARNITHFPERGAPRTVPANVTTCLRRIYSEAKGRARRSGQPFNLTEAQYRVIVDRAAGRCELTGLEFDWGKTDLHRRRPFAASLDRLRPAVPYSAGNCRLVLVVINYALNEWGDEIFDRVARAYVSKREGPLVCVTGIAAG